MSNEDEIWADGSQPAAPNEPCDAMSVDVKDPSTSYNSHAIEASDDAEAIAKALEWAHSHRIGKKVRLILNQGGRAVYREDIDLRSSWRSTPRSAENDKAGARWMIFAT